MKPLTKCERDELELFRQGLLDGTETLYWGAQLVSEGNYYLTVARHTAEQCLNFSDTFHRKLNEIRSRGES